MTTQDFPYPKANNLSKIAAVVDSVHAGANTGVAVAQALDIEEREGSYYADAAGYLGLVDTAPHESVKTYVLTALGTTLRSASADVRVGILKKAVATCEGVRVYAETGYDGAMQVMSAAGLAEATSTRRAHTLASWYNQSIDASHVLLEMSGTQERAFDAAIKAAQEREQRIAAAKPKERTFGTCMSCFMALPATGVCDDCD